MNTDSQPLKEVPWDAPQRGELIPTDDSEPEALTDTIA